MSRQESLEVCRSQQHPVPYPSGHSSRRTAAGAGSTSLRKDLFARKVFRARVTQVGLSSLVKGGCAGPGSAEQPGALETMWRPGQPQAAGFPS